MNKTIKAPDLIDNKLKYFKYYGMHKWREVTIINLKKGDKFRVYSDIGQPLAIDNQETFIAISEVYQIKGDWAIDVEL
jgi:hypothetical protein